jgi:hypothetical protein
MAYLVLKRYSRPFALDDPGFHGEFIYRQPVREDRVLDTAAAMGNCPCGLLHPNLVLLKDGTVLCADHIYKVSELDPEIPYNEWRDY